MATCTKCGSDFHQTPSQVAKYDHACWPCHYKAERVYRKRFQSVQEKTNGRLGKRPAHDGGHDYLRAVISESSVPVTESGCWIWTGQSNNHGYGRIALGSRGRYQSAHRASFMVHKGQIPAGHFVCHRCDTPSCVNPDHLYAGTAADNCHDMLKRGRARFFGRPHAVTAKATGAKP